MYLLWILQRKTWKMRTFSPNKLDQFPIDGQTCIPFWPIQRKGSKEMRSPRKGHNDDDDRYSNKTLILYRSRPVANRWYNQIYEFNDVSIGQRTFRTPLLSLSPTMSMDEYFFNDVVVLSTTMLCSSVAGGNHDITLLLSLYLACISDSNVEFPVLCHTRKTTTPRPWPVGRCPRWR